MEANFNHSGYVGGIRLAPSSFRVARRLRDLQGTETFSIACAFFFFFFLMVFLSPGVVRLVALPCKSLARKPDDQTKGLRVQGPYRVWDSGLRV